MGKILQYPNYFVWLFVPYSLITFEETESTRPSAEDDEFDMFAQSRSSTFADSRNFGSTYDDNREGVPQESFAGVLSARSPYPPLPEGERPQVSFRFFMQYGMS